MHRISLRGRRGQLLTWDLIFGIVIFFIALIMTIELWETSYLELRRAEDEYEMNWLVETVSEQLVRTPGDPYIWTADTVVAFGLVENTHTSKNVESRVLDADKVLNLISSFKENYTRVRNNILGSSKYEIYIEIGCTNKSDLTCLQGLSLDYVTDNVECNNKKIMVSNGRTDNYLWYEAEDLWFTLDDTYCFTKGCSGTNMSIIHNEETKKLKIDSGMYQIWVRTVESSNANAMLTVDGIEHQLYTIRYPGLVTWAWLGQQQLDGDTHIGFSGTQAGDTIDAILLTTDIFYDPRYDYSDNYGNPNNETVCIVGNFDEGANILSSKKTAIVGMPVGMLEVFEGMQTINDKVLDINVVLWKGEALVPRHMLGSGGGTTTTTLSSYYVDCVDGGAEVENCISFNPQWIDIRNMSVNTADNKITCGQDNNVTVWWRGKHAGDDNYFAFFIDDETRLVGSCHSNRLETGGQFFDYEMNCSFNPSPITIAAPDGPHDLIVTGEDFGGFCNASDSNADDEFAMQVDVESCASYTGQTCNPLIGGGKFGCSASSDTVTSIHSIEVTTAPLVCGQPETIRVRWQGQHGSDDSQVQWAFLVEDAGYLCLSKCNTRNTTGENGDKFYELNCNFNMNNAQDCMGSPYTIENGNYTIYAVAESFNGQYCLNPLSPNVEAVDAYAVFVTNCGVAAVTETKTFGYYIGDYTPNPVSAFLYSDISGIWAPTAVDDGSVGSAEMTSHTETVSGIPEGACTRWNVYLNGPNVWLYPTDQPCS